MTSQSEPVVSRLLPPRKEGLKSVIDRLASRIEPSTIRYLTTKYYALVKIMGHFENKPENGTFYFVYFFEYFKVL